MNKKAKELGLVSTNFVTPHGLDSDEHYTTAFDLAIITDYALQNKIFSKIVKTKTYTVTINNNPKTISNTNELLGNFEGVYGVKTGFTNGANRCLVTACKRNDLDVICVVLGCDTKKDRTKDSIKLLNYVFKNFGMVNVKDYIEKEFNKWALIHKNSFRINKGKSQFFNLLLDEKDFEFENIAILNSNNISTEIAFDSCYNAPVEAFSKIGQITLKINDINYYSVDILNNNYIQKKHPSDYFIYILKHYPQCFIPKL